MEKKFKTSHERSVYRQKYKREWESELPWLKKGKDEYHAVCKFCNSEFDIAKGGLKDLRRHETRDYHKRNFSCGSSSSSSSMLNFVTKQNHGVVDAELRWANFICENNLPVKLSDSFSKLAAQMFPDSEIAKNFSCNRTKTSQIITQALGSCAEEIITNMKKSQFTLLIDESTDVSVTRQVVVMARIFTTEVETHLYKVVALRGKATGENLFNVVNNSFEEDNIPWQNCISMSSDGAKSMVGEFNSVLSRIRGKQENVWFLHCTCHVAHLAASHACSELPDLCEQLTRDVYTHFKVSGKRQDEFKNIQQLLDVPEHKILRPCFTRWLAMLQCVDRLLEQWSALQEYFDSKIEPRECNMESVQRIKKVLHSQSAKLYFLFLSATLPRFLKFNLLFQQERPYVHKLYSEMSVLLRQFTASFVQFSAIQQATDITAVNFGRQNQLPNAGIFIGHATRTHLENNQINSQEETEFFNCVRKFYEMGTKELHRLLPLKNEVLKNIDIFDPAKQQSGEWVKVENLAKAFPNVIASNEYDELNSEFVAYSLWDPPAELSTAKTLEPDKYWHKVSQYEINGKTCFPLLCKLAKAMLILPHSNAGVERIFSKLNLIKTAHRSCLESPMLNALLHISSRKNMAEFQPTEEMRNRAKHLKK